MSLTLEERRTRAHDLVRAIQQHLATDDTPTDLARLIATALEPEEVRELSQELAQAVSEALNLPAQACPELTALLQDVGAGLRTSSAVEDQVLTVPGPGHYHAVREALALNTFRQVGEDPWPTAVLASGTSVGLAQLKPPIVESQPLIPPEELEKLTSSMWKQREELSDLDADVLDALSALWLSVATSAKDDAVAGVDDLLIMRGIQPKLGGRGTRGGFRPEQRGEILRSLWHIQNLWIQMLNLEIFETDSQGRPRAKPTRQAVESRAFMITDRLGQYRLDGYMDVQRFIFRPGKVFASFLFGPGRQTALLAARALRYEPNRQRWEKRLTRFFSWQWRSQGGGQVRSESHAVATLLEVVGEVPEERRFGRSRDRLEAALNTLQEDSVISAWRYEGPEEDHFRSRGWARRWLHAKVQVEAPEEVLRYYKALESKARQESKAEAVFAGLQSLGSRLQQRRKLLGLSQSEAAEALGVSQGYFSKLERDRISKGQVGQELRRRIGEWLHESP